MTDLFIHSFIHSNDVNIEYLICSSLIIVTIFFHYHLRQGQNESSQSYIQSESIAPPPPPRASSWVRREPSSLFLSDHDHYSSAHDGTNDNA